MVSTVHIHRHNLFQCTVCFIADVAGQFGPTLENPRVLLSVETATITGGTGRFAGATGSFTVERLLNLDTFLTTVSFEGTISSPGASKH